MKRKVIYIKHHILLITLLLVVLSCPSYSQQYLPLTGGILTGNVSIAGNVQLQVPYLGFDNAAVAQPGNSSNVAIFPNANTSTLDIIGYGNGWRFIPNNGNTYPLPVVAVEPDGTTYIAKSLTLGTTTLPSGYTFAVNGSAIATSFTVQSYANWPDYVFKSSYKLPPLNLVKTYINQNHHLPDVPSEQEVEKQGQNLGEMNKLLLKKVEELTLYLIEKDQKDSEQQQQLDRQSEQLGSQQEQLDQLKAQLNSILKQQKN